jgi:hypothetical protein
LVWELNVVVSKKTTDVSTNVPFPKKQQPTTTPFFSKPPKNLGYFFLQNVSFAGVFTVVDAYASF